MIRGQKYYSADIWGKIFKKEQVLRQEIQLSVFWDTETDAMK